MFQYNFDMEYDILIVGCGPSGLPTALHLAQLSAELAARSASRLHAGLARRPKPTQPFCAVKYIISRRCNYFTLHQKETHARV